MKRVMILALVGAGLVSGMLLHTHHAAATSPLKVQVVLKDYRVMMASRRLPVGRPITFVITNRGRHTHEFVLERANAFDRAIRFGGHVYEADEIKPGTTRKVTWIIPRAGAVKFACHIDHHYQKGMKTLVTARSL